MPPDATPDTVDPSEPIEHLKRTIRANIARLDQLILVLQTDLNTVKSTSTFPSLRAVPNLNLHLSNLQESLERLKRQRDKLLHLVAPADPDIIRSRIRYYLEAPE